MKLSKVVRERYDARTLQDLMEKGIATPYRRRLPGDLDFLNEAYRERVDITAEGKIKGVPIRIHILLDQKDGVPWSWAFILYLAQAERRGRKVDLKKVSDLAEKFSVGEQKIAWGVENHPIWTDSNRQLQIQALNLPPQNMTAFFKALFAKAVR